MTEKHSVMNRRLESHFEVRKANFISKIGDKVTSNEKTFILCKDLQRFCDHIKNLRGCGRVHLKIAIDGGGGSLKICLTVQSDDVLDRSESSETYSASRQKYAEGVSAKKFRESGVEKLFILGLVAGAQENYENVKMLWSMLKINELEYTIATDLKLANILAGLMSHASTFPCTWCTAPKDNLYDIGEYRTLGSCINNHANWINSG
ncbi:hypothetical protein QAD02_024326 [Eretmocerus hayati]|uniref:Uncharacterized protein n=1 Tax=Eretmocerus hayati TaxID=131215 RepID=A0ACC2Q024_9HYME|nr:hypothetical protein QAD02_024326 [Eretmocerus hayati]